MFLSGQDIQERLARGNLRIDPLPDAGLFTTFTIELRLGTEFVWFAPARTGGRPDLASRLFGLQPDRTGPETVALGEEATVSPGTRFLATTLEYIGMPLDLAGLVFPKVSWVNLGLSVETAIIDPGFNGKLILQIQNSSSQAIVLRPGLRMARLYLATLNRASNITHAPEKISEDIAAEIQSVKNVLQQTAPRVAASALSTQLLKSLWSEVLTAKGTTKGKALEELMAKLFTSLDGLSILKRNARLRAEELDLVIKNDLTSGFWRIAGSPLIVECKNWTAKVGAREISVLIDKLQALSPDAKVGVLVTLNGITGDSGSDAVLKIREGRQRGRYVLVFDRADLEKIIAGGSFAELIERKYAETILL